MSTATATAPDRTTPQAPSGPVEIWRAMLEFHAEVIGRLETAFRSRHDLSVSEFDVLINLGPHEHLRHGELAERVILTRTALTRLIDRLVARGLLTRTTSARDQRAVLISLTDDGRTLRRAAARTNAAVARAPFAALNPQQLQALGETIQTLRNAAQGSDEGKDTSR
ncbi:MarR family winged helix-turn-helix transcriptional regulator [Janibacter sp. GXQ6167]|uniref:MarR family winged helix-turn-helix transcriptional regulator n=1 Tax=Janibacter sp. GXQ6167 TaxID=3240791 RepID=UPI003523D3E5